MKHRLILTAVIAGICLPLATFKLGMSYQKEIQLPAIQKVVNVGRSTINNLSQQLDTCNARLKEAHRVNGESVQKRIRSFDEIFQQGERG